MDLSNDLISKFVKITNDGDKKKTKEGTVYGTAVKYDGNMYVKIDGSDLLTPIDTTADIKEGERVTIMIKDHNATVTGNVTSPSASSADVKKVTKNVEEIEGEITEFEAIIADVVHVGELDAEVARIDELIAGKADIEDLTATNAEITNLKAKDAEIENLVAEKATIEDLTATNAEITNLKAKDAEIENLVADKATIEDLTATNARIDSLQANKADINYLDANFATIDELEATHANIDVLDAEVASINTLVNGNLTSDNILSFNITSKNTTMEDAFIKDAMIDRITANKIMSGTIDTNNVTIQSTDGSMLLQGTLLQMKDDNGKVRIQIGKDTGGNFTFVLYDESGTGVLIDEEGIKSSDAIADGLIVDAKVADNANIAGSKLDIASVITEVNNDNGTTIKSNKIYLDEQGQSLEVAFNSLKTHVDTIQDVTIDGDLTEVIEQVQSNTTQIAANKEGISTLVSENTSRKEEIQNLDGEIESVNNTLSSKYSSLEQDVSGFKTTVAETYATKQSVTDVSNNLATNYSTTSAMNSAIQQKANEITSSVSQTYATKSEFNNLQIGGTNLLPHSGNFKDNCGLWITNGSSITLETVITYNGHNTIKIHNDSSNGIIYSEYISLKPNTTYTYSITAVAAGVVTGDNLRPLHMWVHPQGDGSNIHREEILDSSHAGIGTRWGRSYIVFKTPDTDDFYLMKPFIYQTEGQIIYIANFKVEEGNRPTDWSPAPEDVQRQIDATNNNLAVNYSTTSQMNSAIQQKANEITSSVSQTYATKQSVTDVNNNLTNNYSTTSQMNSAIQQKANEITSSVSQTYTTKSEFNNLQIGGKNLLLNSKRETTNNGYCIDSFRPTELFEVGEKYTVSICVTPANGVTHIHPYISGGWAPLSIPLYVNGTTRQVLSITFTFNGYNSDKVPVDISDYNAYVQFYRFPNDGTVTGNTTLHWVKVEKGAKATDWTPAPEDVQTQIDTINTNLTTYATKSELTQTNNSIVAKFSESGGYNLIRNSTGAGVSTNGWIHTATSMGVDANDGIGSANRYYLYLDNGTTTTERYAYSSRFKLKPNTTYRFTGYFLNYTKCPSFDVFVLSSTSLPDTDTTTGYTNVHNLIQSASTRGVWKKYTTTFTTPASTKSGILRIDNNGYDQSGTNSNRVHWNCLILTEGEMEVPWSPHPSEIYDGITKIDKNGLQVSQSNYNGYTQMKADGFYVNNGSENVISITKDGSYFKGKVVITSGSTVPTSVLSGTISSAQLDSGITSDISTAKSNASTAVSTANTASTNASNAVKTANTASTNASTAVSTANTASTNASNAVSTANTASTNASNAVKTANKASTNASTAVSTANTAKSTADTAKSTADSVKSTVDSGKTNWNNAYNRVNDWAYGAVTGSTTIDGGYIQADTITAKHMAIGDFNNYSQLVKGKSLTNRYGTATWTEGTSNHSYWVTTNRYFPFTVNETLNPFKASDRVQIKFDAYTPSTRNVQVGIWFYSGTAADTNIGTITADVSCSATWGTKTVNLTLPSGNTYVQSAKSIAILITNGTSGERIEVRNVTIRRLVAGDLIVDGAITAAKIASRTITADRIVSGAITANEIAANAITAAKISSGAITADKLAANAITSKTITGSTITGGTISGATITSETLMKTYGGMYVGSEIWGGFAKNSSGTYESINQFNIKASKNLFLQGNNVYIYPSTGEVKIGDTSSYDNLRARCLYAQEIVYTDDIRARTTGAALTMENISMRAANAYVQFTSGPGVVRVKERNHLYLQTGGNTGGDTSAEIRCTRYTDASNYVNIRAHNVCAQNAVYAAGVNVSSDRARKRDIELYSTDALQEVCSTPVYAYHLDTDKDEELKRIGIIMQEAPLDAIDLTGKGVDLYQMVTMLWRAVQQQQEIINELKGE